MFLGVAPPTTFAEIVFLAGRTTWPDVTLPFERIAGRASQLDGSLIRLADHAADLFLAFACAEGEPEALRHFESEMLSQLEVYVARFRLAPHVLDELRQQVRVKLLVGSAPGIAQYRGNGPLRGWLRVTAVRMAIDLGRSARETAAWPDTHLLDLALGIHEGPEQGAGRRLYRERFRAALERALAALDKRDKTLLRLAAIDNLSGEAIGAIYRVHRSTVARWFVAIRTQVLLSVRQELRLPKAPAASEIRSLVNLLRDDIDISARRILASSSNELPPVPSR
jgi:RNA polymerase sigma-70 factor (ECF subfamily)